MHVWLQAIRPKTLTAGFIPVVVGTTLAFNENGVVNLWLSLCCLLFAISIQIGTNLINDALDFQKGVDTEKRIGPVRVAQMGLLTPSQVLSGGVAFLLIGTLFCFPLAVQGGFLSACLLALSIALAYLYTGGPYPLSYIGLGEVFVFLFFGLVGTVGSYYIQTLHFTWPAIIAGGEVGLLATLLIAVNNVRDYYTDTQANKRTIVVRYGINFGKGIISLCALAPFALNLFWISERCYASALLPWIILPLALLIVRSVWQMQPSKEYNRLLGLSALLHLAFNLLFTLGFFV